MIVRIDYYRYVKYIEIRLKKKMMNGCVLNVKDGMDENFLKFVEMDNDWSRFERMKWIR